MKPKAYSMTWAQRHEGVFVIGIEKCEKCGGQVRVIVCIEDPVVTQTIFKHLGPDTVVSLQISSLPEALFESTQSLLTLDDQRGRTLPVSRSPWRFAYFATKRDPGFDIKSATACPGTYSQVRSRSRWQVVYSSYTSI